MFSIKNLFSRGRTSGKPEGGEKSTSRMKDSLAAEKQPSGSGQNAPPSKIKKIFSGVKIPRVGMGALPRIKDLFSGSKQLVGLDIGSSALKLFEVVDNKGGPFLNRFYQIPLERGVIVDGALVDPDKLSQTAKELFKQAGFSQRGIVTSLSGHSAIIKKVTFPSLEENELRDMIHDEASKYLPFDNMDEVNFDFQILGKNEYNSNQMEVILVAAKKDIIESYTDALESAGLTVMIMDVDSFALETMYEANYDFEDSDVVVLVNIGASITNINVVKGGRSVFTRDFTLGGNTMTEAIQATYGLPFEAAEQLKIQGPEGDEQVRQSFWVSLLTYAAPICVEIERSVDYYRSTSGGENIKKILLAGGVANVPGIVDELSQRLNIEAEIVNPFIRVDYKKKEFSAEQMQKLNPVAGVGIGLALRRLGDK
jgi:type IV pilus assembly protein PilM